MAAFIVDGGSATLRHTHPDGSRVELRFIGDSLQCATCGETLCGCLDGGGIWVAEGEEFYHLHPGLGKQPSIVTPKAVYCPVCMDCSPWHRDE